MADAMNSTGMSTGTALGLPTIGLPTYPIKPSAPAPAPQDVAAVAPAQPKMPAPPPVPKFQGPSEKDRAAIETAGAAEQAAIKALGDAQAAQLEKTAEQTKLMMDPIYEKLQNESVKYRDNIEQAIKDTKPFVPTKSSVGDMALLFTLIGMIGSTLGSQKGTMSALGAQNAMTGMLQGWQKGDADRYQKEKATFEENLKYQQRVSELTKQAFDAYKDEVVTVGIPRAKENLDAKLASYGADVIKKTTDQKGAEAGERVTKDLATWQEKAKEAYNKILEAGYNRSMEIWKAEISAQSKLPDTASVESIATQIAEYKLPPFTGISARSPAALAIMSLVAKLNPDYDGTKWTGKVAAERTLGTQTGRVTGSIESLKSTVPLALAASNNVDRTKFPDVNSIENAIRSGTGDKSIVQFNIFNQSLVNDYALIMRRGGASTDAASERANDILSTSFSNGQYEAGVKALQQEADAVKQGLANAEDAVSRKKTTSGPAIGTVSKGHIYLGGDPHDPKSWEKV